MSYSSKHKSVSEINALKPSLQKEHTELELDLLLADLKWCEDMEKTIREVRANARKACPHPVNYQEFYSHYYTDTYGTNGYSKRYLTCRLCNKDLYKDSTE